VCVWCSFWQKKGKPKLEVLRKANCWQLTELRPRNQFQIAPDTRQQTTTIITRITKTHQQVTQCTYRENQKSQLSKSLYFRQLPFSAAAADQARNWFSFCFCLGFVDYIHFFLQRAEGSGFSSTGKLQDESKT